MRAVTVLQKVLDGKTMKFYQECVLLCWTLSQELVMPQVSSDKKVLPVAEWLEAEARELGVSRILVEDPDTVCV
eukprot:g30039.t2